MELPVMNMDGQEVNRRELPAVIFEADVNRGLMHQALVRQLANARLGTHKTKGRSEVRYSTAKIYRQKGTGRARHGSRRAPIFVGGGVAHGPRPRDYSKKMPRQMRRAALRSALSVKAESGDIVLVDEIAMAAPKTKEMALLVSGCVQRFDCYEFSKNRIERAKKTAAKYGVAERMSFHRADAFESKKRYDLVYWNNALHHMMDVRRAVEWSSARLVGGGCFAMDDYVGPTGFQWDDLHLHYANAFRERLSDDFFARVGEKPIARILRRRDPKKLWARDPSEAADSGNIMSAVREYFQDAEIVYTGGAIYHTALNGILQNIDEDSEVLDEALALDDFMIRIGYSNYAVAISHC